MSFGKTQFIKVPAKARPGGAPEKKMEAFNKTIFKNIMKDEGYFPPCHQREQEFGQPHIELLGLIPGMKPEAIQGSLYCCGLAGVMGFKRDFHESSVKLGSRLIDKIKEMNPEVLVTDCLSCRLQFKQLLSNKVLHPIEVLKEAYHAAARDNRLKAHG